MMPDDAERTLLAGDDWIYQRKRGHRTSTDDVVTAARAVVLCDGAWPARYLDLGCGIGSVLLFTARVLRPEYAVGWEAQEESVALLRQTLAEMPCSRRPSVELRDLRDADEAGLGRFDLITGSPPYFPLGTGVEPVDPQRRACRFEVRGGVEAYLAAASRLLAPEGRFVMVAQTGMDARVARAASAAGLTPRSKLQLWMRADRQDSFLTVTEVRSLEGPCPTVQMAIRDAAGGITPAYRALRLRLGLSSKD